jgi:hypothetical protein
VGKVKPENEWKFKCAMSGKAIKRRKRYYRNGKYFLNKASYQAFVKKQKADADTAAAAAAAAAPAAEAPKA